MSKSEYLNHLIKGLAGNRVKYTELNKHYLIDAINRLPEQGDTSKCPLLKKSDVIKIIENL